MNTIKPSIWHNAKVFNQNTQLFIIIIGKISFYMLSLGETAEATGTGAALKE